MADTISNADKEGLKVAAGQILLDCNRCIHTWNERAKSSSRTYKMDYTELRGLVHNWIARHIRNIIGASATHRLFRGGIPFLDIDPKNGYISKIKFSSESGRYAYTNRQIYEELSKLFEEIDYRAFYYDPNTADISNITVAGVKTQIASSNNFIPTFSKEIELDLTSLTNHTF